MSSVRSDDAVESEAGEDTPERRLADFVAHYASEQIPAEAVESARRELLWSLGTILAGSGAHGSREVGEYAVSLGQGPSSILGFARHVSVEGAGLANGCYAKALEWEDKFWMDYGHAWSIGTSVVPSALAVAESLPGVSGRALLDAIALATDLQARLVSGIPNAFGIRPWNPSYLYSSFGSAAAAGRLLGLSTDQLVAALGMAYGQAAGNRENIFEGTLGGRLQMGFGVRNGIAAAQLALRDVSGAADFLCGPHGMHRAFYGDEGVDVLAYTRELGSRFVGADLGFKAYPCCAAMHPALDAARDVLDTTGISWDEIRSVTVYGSTRMRNTVYPADHKAAPETEVDAQFSLPWATSCMLVDGTVSVRHFQSTALADERYGALAQRVHARLSDDGGPVRVEVETEDGRSLHSREVTIPSGHPENPLSMARVIEVFDECAQIGAIALDKSRRSQVRDMVLGIEDLSDVSALTRILS